MLFRSQLWENNSALKAGFEVLRDAALPIETRVSPGTDAIQHNALMNSRREGYYDALRNIEALKELKRSEEQLPEPWSNVKKEE